MKVMFSVGEASGDVHAASVAHALRKMYPDIELFGMGGEKMRAAGVRIDYDIRELGCIGLVEIVKKLPFFFRLRDTLLKWVERERPDVVVCVDYPGFNMRLAASVHARKVPVLYYIAPTIWAWHRSRGYSIAKHTDAVACIFPFEEAAYREMGANATFVGHPLLDTVCPEMTKEEARRHFGMRDDAKQLLLLPGSRKQEVMGLLDVMLEAADTLSQHYPVQCYLPRASTISRESLQEIVDRHAVEVMITETAIYDLMQVCTTALAASGTVTLETALMGLPTVLVYRVAPLTYWLGKHLVQLDFIGLPNIIAGREVIPELLQEAASPERMVAEIDRLWQSPEQIEKMRQDLVEVRARLGSPGAVRRVAELVAKTAKGDIHA